MAVLKVNREVAKNKNETEWVEPLSAECQQWWAAAHPQAWWVIQIPYALWHMPLEGFGKERGYGVRSMGAWEVEHVSVGEGGGACFDISFGKWWEGLLTSPSKHTLQKDTTPSSWRHRERKRESTGRKQGGNRKQNDRRQNARQDRR